MTEERRVVIEAEVNTTQTRAGFAEIGQQANSMAASVARTSEQAERAVAGIGTGAGASARNVENAQRSLIASIERTTAQMQAGSRTSAQYFETLARQRGVDPGALTPYLNALRAVEQAQTRTGVSAAQTANAMRMVPAQLTDIVVGLQGGQAPLTVLLQQGGQLRDTFGSAGGALRGVASAAMGLVTPWTLAAAAVGALAVAYYKGSQEAQNYTKAIILSGNAAGTTTSQLSDSAAAIAKIGGTQSQAAEALVALVNAGKVGSASLEKFGAVAVAMSKNVGVSVADTAKDFAELGKAPVQATLKLNEQLHYLNVTTFDRIKFLQDQGRQEEAASVAQNAYADAMKERADKVKESLGVIEKGWRSAGDTAKWAWDRMLDVGRDKTPAQELAEINSKIARANPPVANAGANSDGREMALARLREELPALQARRAELEKSIGVEKEAAKAKAAADAVAAAHAKFVQDGEPLLTREVQLQRALNQAVQDGKAGHETAEVVEKRLADIRLSFADIYNDKVEAQIATLKRKDQVEDLLNQRELQRIATLKTLGSLTEEQAVNQTADADLAQYDRHIKQIEAEIALKGREANSKKAVSDLEGQIDGLRVERDNREKQRGNDLLILAQKRETATQDLFNKGIQSASAERDSIFDSVKADKQRYEQLGLTKAQIADLTAQQYEHSAALKIESAESIEALEPGSKLAAIYREQAEGLRQRASVARDTGVKEAFQQEAEEAKKAAVSINQSLTDALLRGFESGKGFAENFRDTLKNMFATLVLRPTISAILAPVSQGLSSGISSILGNAGVQGASAGQSGGSDAIGFATAAANLYKLASSGFEAVGTSIGQGLSYIGNQVGSQSLNAFGGGMQGFGADGSLGAAGGAGSAAGSFVNGAAGAVAGHYIGNAIAGDYSINHGQAVTNIASIIGAVVGGPIGGAIGGAIGGLINRAFGHGSTEVQSQGIRGTVSATDLTGTSYQNLHQNGGFFTSDRNWEGKTDFTSDMVKQFTQGLSAIEDASTGFAKSLGVSSDSINDYSKSFDLTLTGDATKDQEIIAKFFAGIGDEIANKLVPNLDTFAKSGEAASAVLQRLAGDFQATDKVAQLLGTTAESLFRGTGMDTAAARERLIGAAGGADVLGQQASFYSQNFLSDEQRLAPVADAVAKAMASIGLASVTTREQFKSTVDGLIASGAILTDAGSAQFESLMKLAEAFNTVAAASEAKQKAIGDERKSLQDQLDDLTLSDVQLLKKQRDALDESNRSIFDQIQAKKEEKTAAEAAAAAISKAQEKAAAALQAQAASIQSLGDALSNSMKNATAAAKALRAFNDSLKLGSLSTLSKGDQYGVAKQAYLTADDSTRQAAATAFLEASKALNGSSVNYARDFATVTADLGKKADSLDAFAARIPDFFRAIQGMGMFGSVGAHANGGVGSGWSLVGEQGPELVNFTNPGRVYTASQSREMMAAGPSNDLMNKLLQATKENRDNTRRLADQFENWTSGGNVATVEMA